MIQNLRWTRAPAHARNAIVKSAWEKTLLQILMLERVEPERNMHRYYVMSLEPTLFGDIGLRREWGRLGNKGGQTRLELHQEPHEAREALEVWLQRKFRRGYRLRLVDETSAAPA